MDRSEPVSLRDVIAITSDVIFQNIEGEAVLLNAASGAYFDLNGTGTFIWNVLSENGSLAAAHSKVVRHYAVEPEVAEDELLKLTGQLLTNGLIRIVRE
jgi:hypothetical protein